MVRCVIPVLPNVNVAEVSGDFMKFSINTVYQHISPYPIMIISSVVIGIMVQYFLNINRGIPKNKSRCLLFTEPIMSIVFGVMLTYYTSGRKTFGLSSIGGLMGMYAGIILISMIEKKRDEFGILIQNCTLILPLMYSVSKVGCVFAGCCHGFEYDGIFSIEYIGKENIITVFPVQAAEVFVFAIIFIIGICMYKMRKKYSVSVIFILSAFSKAMLDFLRESHQGKIISINQILCIILIIIELAVLIYKKENNRQIKKKL